MKILVIGGTHFVGRHFVEAALARGHEITLFNRGKSGDVFPNVENLRGDREVDLSALKGRHWDAVVDTCGYVPRVVRMSAELLKDQVDRYLFISTISVYDVMAQRDEDENAKLQTLADPTTEEITNESYGGLKVLCEDAVNEIYGDRALNVRPGMIVGPFDPTDRYTYWDVRTAKGGEVLVPGSADRPVQMIDARDLGAWMVHLLENNVKGTFNATGPNQPLTWNEWMDVFHTATGSQATFTFVGDEFLAQRDVNGGDLPFWVPAEYENLFAVSVQKAVDAGLTFRAAVETARDTLAWRGANDVTDLKLGLKPEREAELLATWHQH